MKTIFDYAKLSAAEKNEWLNNDAILIENYRDKENIIMVYYLNGFFVELTMKHGIIIDNIPYKRGYRFDKRQAHALEKRNAFYNQAA